MRRKKLNELSAEIEMSAQLICKESASLRSVENNAFVTLNTD